MGNYGKKYGLVKARVDQRMGHKLGKWGKFKAFFKDSSFTPERKQIIDEEIHNVYAARRGSFAGKRPQLQLDTGYHPERDNPEHLYPGSHDKVRYVPPADRGNFKVQFNGGRLEHGVRKLDGAPKPDLHTGREKIFVRSDSMDDLTYVTEKASVDIAETRYKTQHSSFKQGQNVVSAGKLEFDDQNRLTKVKGSSGHYKPDKESLYKFAEFGEQSGQFNPDALEWTYGGHIQKSLTMNPEQRKIAVAKWAVRNPKED